MPLSFCYMDLSIFPEVDSSVHVYKFIALQTFPLRQGNLFNTVYLSVSQKEVVLIKSNSSQLALPVALGAGCDHRRLSSLDVCRQVMKICHMSKLYSGFYLIFFNLG